MLSLLLQELARKEALKNAWSWRISFEDLRKCRQFESVEDHSHPWVIASTVKAAKGLPKTKIANQIKCYKIIPPNKIDDGTFPVSLAMFRNLSISLSI
jgi:hypothetical protein